MKRHIFFLLCVAFMSAGCDSDLLNKYPLDKVSTETFWKTKNDAISGVNGVYDVLHAEYMFNTYPFLDGLTPAFYSESWRYKRLSLLTQTSYTPSCIAGRWGHAYKGIGRANTVLANIDRCDISEDLLSRLKAETKFLRALYYHELVTAYGDVPLILTPPATVEDALLPRTPKKVVVDSILVDLDYAISKLPKEPEVAGRVTKGAALALKARVLLYEGSWKEVEEVTDDLMELGCYKLFPSYDGLFKLANENNSEVIWDIQFISNVDEGNKIDKYLGNRMALASGWNNLQPTLDMIAAYEYKDSGKLPEYKFTDGMVLDTTELFHNKDPRLEYTLIRPGAWFREYQFVLGKNGEDNSIRHRSQTGLMVRKYVMDDDNGKAWDSPLNFIVFRYADVLLMNAEAKVELLPDGAVVTDQTVYDNINEVRTRPDVGLLPIELGKTKEEMRVIIRHERKVEFAVEGTLYGDMLRWGEAEKLENWPIFGMHYNKETGEFLVNKLIDRTFDSTRDYLWPIPRGEREKNEHLGQNPIYID